MLPAHRRWEVEVNKALDSDLPAEGPEGLRLQEELPISAPCVGINAQKLGLCAIKVRCRIVNGYGTQASKQHVDTRSSA